jgi:hypothetical protein
MAKSKKKPADEKTEPAGEVLDDLLQVEKGKIVHEPESHGNSQHGRDNDPLKDRHGSPLNIPPKGMDA